MHRTSVDSTNNPPVLDSVRTGLHGERIYRVLPDRFANGDCGNDTGGLPGDRLVNGFDPTSADFYLSWSRIRPVALAC